MADKKQNVLTQSAEQSHSVVTLKGKTMNNFNTKAII